MVCSCGATRHVLHRSENRLLKMLCQVCPEEASTLMSWMNEECVNVRSAVGVLCALYKLQNVEIHRMALQYDPGMEQSYGDHEWRWITQGEPARFFELHEKALREHHPEIFEEIILLNAWIYFQAFLMAEHIVYTARLQGRFPSPEERYNEGYTEWSFRLAKRFEPIRSMPAEALH